jgi:hypothetical protein
MTVSRPRVLRTGDDILLDGELHTVEAVSGTMVRLANVVGAVSSVPAAELLARTFAIQPEPQQVRARRWFRFAGEGQC